MSAAVFHSGTPSLAVPQTQNTAPVLEFSCLYTHDVRKKSKKWQDGFLRYHTFNKRIMVYDLPRNFVGDVHWKSSVALQEGDEITLDDGTVIVEVGENIGSTQTDLTELTTIAKRSTREDGHASSPVRTSASRRAPTPSSALRGQSQLKHRSLNALLGSARGQAGRASLPAKSPFEINQLDSRNASPDHWPPAKRLKSDHSAIRTPLSPRSVQQQVVARSITSKQHRPNMTSAKSVSQSGPVVDLSNDEVDGSTYSTASMIAGLASSPPVEQKQPKTSSHSANPEEQVQPISACLPENSSSRKSEAAPEAKSLQSLFFTGERGMLQITTNAPKRKMLLCESQLSGRPKTASTAEPIKSQRQILQERLDRLSKKTKKAVSEPNAVSKHDTPERPSEKDADQGGLLEPQNRTLRRVASDSGTAFLPIINPAENKAAPVRTSAPRRTEYAPEAGIAPSQPKQESRKVSRSPKPKKSLQRSVSLNMTGSGTTTVMLRRQFQAPTAPKPNPPSEAPPVQPNAWSREAFDLFEWRPPDWDEAKWCFQTAGNEK